MNLGCLRGSLLAFLLLLGFCDAEDEDFSCHKGGLFYNGDIEKGAIIPREDIIIEVNKQEKEVFCRFNSSVISSDDVFFDAKDQSIQYDVVNASTIGTKISHSEPKFYLLNCKLKRKKKDPKRLCSQYVKAGYPPLDIENLNCISWNSENVNCTWDEPYNPVRTKYNVSYSVPGFYLNRTELIKINERQIFRSPCPQTNMPKNNSCFWDHSQRLVLRDEFDLHFGAQNELGRADFTHRIKVPEIVIPTKVDAAVTLVGPLRARASWYLTYPMDVFIAGLWHFVEYRMKGRTHWLSVTRFFHRSNHTNLNPKQSFSVETNLSFANTAFEFRVRIQSGAGELSERRWSDFELLSITTEPVRPWVAPLTASSAFEVVEGLVVRDVYVNFRDVDDVDKAGNRFRYQVEAFDDAGRRLAEAQPAETTKAYFKFNSLNFSAYRFRITPANEKGVGSSWSEVFVPASDCMPKKTDMFTVISSTAEGGAKLFSLYWTPSRPAAMPCDDAAPDTRIDSYTIFWCKKTFGYRCKEKLLWKEVPLADLATKDLSHVTPERIVIFELNMTTSHSDHALTQPHALTDALTAVGEDAVLSFGVAANAGAMSSGIRWSSCIVDETEPPLPPIAHVEALANDSRAVLVKWSLKCMSLSAVPVGFNVSFCESVVQDFGHCTSQVRHVKVSSPSQSEVLISDLDAGASYIFSVAVLSIIGEGRQSDPKIMRLREATPSGPPLRLRLLEATNTSAHLSWLPPLKAHRGGVISHYEIILDPPHVKDVVVLDRHLNEGEIAYTVRGLHPFTRYNAKVSACNAIGCGFGFNFTAPIDFNTTAGAPGAVENLSLDANNWRLVWDLSRCNSRNCSFQLRIPANETHFRQVFVLDKETLSLREEGVPCNHSQMTFSVRAIGSDNLGRVLYGPWASVTKAPSECPPEFMSWWAIALLVMFCGFLTVAIFLSAKFGCRFVEKVKKDWKQKINLPKGINKVVETKEPLKEFSSNADPPLLYVPPSKDERRHREETASDKFRSDSVSSEEVHLIAESSAAERHHGRNVSGSSSSSSSSAASSSSSDQSSGQFSAPTPASPSPNHLDIANGLPAELLLSQGTTLRQRTPTPPYVHHGFMPDKLTTEGYVTAWSVPSLPHLFRPKNDDDAALQHQQQQSTPDLNDVASSAHWQSARRASTGYISMPDSDAEASSKGGTRGASVSPPVGYSCLPYFSRHSFSPDATKPGSAKGGGYTTLPSASAAVSVGYVAAGDPFGALKMPPSIHAMPKSPSAEDEGALPVGAYCRVGARASSAGNPASGYVSAARIGDIAALRGAPPPAGKPLPTSASHPDVVAVSFLPQKSAAAPYVQLKDAGGRWAQPRATFAGASDPPPAEGAGVSRVGTMPRPNTTDAAMGRREADSPMPPLPPSLSKQSSGYVSQETLTTSGGGGGGGVEGVVMSPRRLLSRVASPHTVVLSPSHQASMV